jgi:hypothetical protein
MAPLRRRHLRLVTTRRAAPALRWRWPRRGRVGTFGPASVLRFLKPTPHIRPLNTIEALLERAAPQAPFVHSEHFSIKNSAFSVQRSPHSPASPPPPHPLPDNPCNAPLLNPCQRPSGDIFLQLSRTCADPIQASPLKSPGAPRSRQPAFQLQPSEAHPATRPMHPDGGSCLLSLSKAERWKCEVQRVKCESSEIPSAQNSERFSIKNSAFSVQRSTF